MPSRHFSRAQSSLMLTVLIMLALSAIAIDRAAAASPDESGAVRTERATPTATPTGTVARSAARPTATPRPTRTPTMTPTPFPVTPGVVNGVPIDQFLVMSDTVRQNIRVIFARGQALGNNAHAFSTAGDSTIEVPYFLGAFDTTKYRLGGYAYLQLAIDYYAGSWGRDSAATRISQHAWTLLNPTWADKKVCEANESPLACELRLHRPSLLIIRVGVNDPNAAKLYETSLRKVVEFAIEHGVIPILSTKPDQRAGTEGNNDIVRKLAAEYAVPLWDYELVARTLPDRGLGPDGAHSNGFWQNDYGLALAYQRGHAMQSLTALMVIDQIWRALN